MRIINNPTLLCSLAALVATGLDAQTLTNWTGGAADGNIWSTPGNWDNGAPGAGIDVIVNSPGDTTVNVNTPGAVQTFKRTGGGGTLTVAGPGGLTLNHSGDLFLSNDSADVLQFNTPVRSTSGKFNAVNNYWGGTLRFNNGLHLVNAGTQVRNQGNGMIEFDGGVTGEEGTSFQLAAGGHTIVGGTVQVPEIVLMGAANTGLNINGGSIVGGKFQNNSSVGKISFNAPNVVSNIGVSLAAPLILDVNADQTSFAWLALFGQNLTIDLTGGHAIAFANSSTQPWGVTGQVSISGFTPNSVRFGTDATGLSALQLTAFGGAYTIDANGYLVPEPGTYAMILGLFALGFTIYRRKRVR